MDFLLLASIILCFVVSSHTPAIAQVTPSSPTQACVRELTPINFGDVMVGAFGGTVTISPDSRRKVTGSVLAVAFSDNHGEAGELVIERSGAQVGATHLEPPKLIFPAAVALRAETGHMLKLSEIQHKIYKVVGLKAYVHVGATLSFGPDQASGRYAATLPVTLSYE